MFLPTLSWTTVKTAFHETFPNIYNLPLMLILGASLYAASSVITRLTANVLVARSLSPVSAVAGVRSLPAVPAVGRSRRWVLSLVSLTLVAGVATAVMLGQDKGGVPPQLVAQHRQILPNPEERNLKRQVDLGSIEAALAEYRSRKGTYPSTDGKTQSLCFYDGLDAGCGLKELRGELPFDPLGRHNGYWYISNGQKFTLLSDWEGDADPPSGSVCPIGLLGSTEDRLILCAGEGAR